MYEHFLSHAAFMLQRGPQTTRALVMTFTQQGNEIAGATLDERREVAMKAIADDKRFKRDGDVWRFKTAEEVAEEAQA